MSNIFEVLKKGPSFTEIARRAGVSRATLNNARIDPERRTLQTLRKIFDAIGYNIVLTLEKKVETLDEDT